MVTVEITAQNYAVTAHREKLKGKLSCNGPRTGECGVEIVLCYCTEMLGLIMLVLVKVFVRNCSSLFSFHLESLAIHRLST